jgi:hypothetical protein
VVGGVVATVAAGAAAAVVARGGVVAAVVAGDSVEARGRVDAVVAGTVGEGAFDVGGCGPGPVVVGGAPAATAGRWRTTVTTVGSTVVAGAAVAMVGPCDSASAATMPNITEKLIPAASTRAAAARWDRRRGGGRVAGVRATDVRGTHAGAAAVAAAGTGSAVAADPVAGGRGRP